MLSLFSKPCRYNNRGSKRDSQRIKRERLQTIHMIYVDHAATTPISSVARNAMLSFLSDDFGNPSTLYSLARKPRQAIENARESIASAIGASPEEIFFTSGGTEADNWALKGIAYNKSKGKEIITSSIEHHAIINTCKSLEQNGHKTIVISVDNKGIIRSDELRQSFSKETILLSVMMANNEIGTIEPIRELADISHSHGVPIHTDAVQAIGHIPIDVNSLQVDMLSASAHKFNGPKGVGFLYVRKGIELLPLINGGSQERNMRAGTENVPGIVGMAAALSEHVARLKKEMDYLESLRDELIAVIHAYGLNCRINGSENHIPGSLSLSFQGEEGERLLYRLSLKGIYVATGAACDSIHTSLSHVIQSIGVPDDYAYGTIRITMGTENTKEEMQEIAKQLKQIIAQR